jgi:hypothetical protein
MKTILYKFEIDGVIYYYGLRKDDVKGIMIGMDDLKLENHIHQLYIPEEVGDDIVLNKARVDADYILIKKILEDIVSAGFYDKCDIYTKNECTLAAYAHNDFIITNSNNHKFIIKGLISKIWYSIDPSNNEIKVKNYSGVRSKQTHIENRKSYLHSHLRRIAEENTYCLGISDLGNRFSDIISIEDLDVIYDIILVDNFVKWESLEGGPYVRMLNMFEDLIESISSNSIINLTREDLDNINFKLTYQDRMFNVNLEINNQNNINIQKDVLTDKYYYGDNCQYEIKKLLKLFTNNTVSSRLISYYFKGNKTSEIITFSKEEINIVLNSMMKKSNISNTQINEIINTDIFKPTLMLE